MKTILMLTSFLLSTLTFGQDAKEIIRKAYEKTEGLSHESEMTMTIQRPTWTRTLSFKAWTKGEDFSLVIITEPVKEKGQTFLKRKTEMWNWIPSIQRMVKLPPSMLSQGWMGSDYTNDDMLKQSSIVDDYDHTLMAIEKANGYDCYKIKLVPKPDAAIVWGFIIKWISKDGYHQIKSEYYDEDDALVKTENASEIKRMDDREIPTKFEIIPADKPGNITLVVMKKAKFNVKIEDSFFFAAKYEGDSVKSTNDDRIF